MVQSLFDHLKAKWHAHSIDHFHRFFLRDTDEMVAFGAELAKTIRLPRVIALSGDLGAGKTTLAKGMISALTGTLPSEVTSPTFQYVQFYTEGSLIVAHFDVWRLASADEFVELGLEEYLSSSLAIVEWPERINRVLPADTLRVNTSINDGGRFVTIDFKEVS